MTELQVLIVADDPLARAGLAALLDERPDLVIAGQVSGETDLETALDVYRPDVLVWDLGWEPESALANLSDLQEVGFPILALLPDGAYVLDAWSTGVRGLLPREVAADALVAALTSIAEGLVVLDPTLAEALRPSPELSSELLVEELTPRELEVLQLLAQGLSNRAIGYDLEISEHTVKFHVNAIMTKLGAQSRTEAAVRATRMGLIFL